jgi:hypothetical protein
MSGTWSLPDLLANLHTSIEADLRQARATLAHPTEKGDASEAVWIDVLNKYLPRRYQASKAHVVDSRGSFSEQMDVVIHDRQYSPLVFTFKESLVLPAESVYAVFEAKQDMTSEHRICPTEDRQRPVTPSDQHASAYRRRHQTGQTTRRNPRWSFDADLPLDTAVRSNHAGSPE